jgi:hypothetical protein
MCEPHDSLSDRSWVPQLDLLHPGTNDSTRPRELGCVQNCDCLAFGYVYKECCPRGNRSVCLEGGGRSMCSARAEISEKRMVESMHGSLNAFNVWLSSFKVVNSPQSRDGDRNETFRGDSIGR